MSKRMWVLATTAWIAVVIAGSALTWVAIDRAGQQVSGEPSAAQTQPIMIGTILPPATDTTIQSRTSTPTAPTAPIASSASTATRTWSDAAGTVTVSCTSQTARLMGTSPSDGWHVDVSDSSGDEVKVKFKNEKSKIQVKATCSGGVPRFQVESDTPH